MLLKRWGSLLLILLMTLAACGTADTPDVAQSDTGVEASTTPDGPYPAPATTVPVTPAPATEIVPTNTSIATLTATSVVTEVPQAEIAVLAPDESSSTLDPITVMTATTITLHDSGYPMYLAGWSPNEHMILYTTSAESNGIDRVDIYTVDIRDGRQYVLAKDAIGAISSSWGRDHDSMPPQWSATCCDVFYATAASSTTQQIMKTDWQGTQQTQLATTAQGPFFLSPQQEVVVATDQGLDIGSTVQALEIPALRDEFPRTSYTTNGDQLYTYIAQDRKVLHVGSIEPPFKEQALTLDLLLQQSRMSEVIQADDPYFPGELYFDFDALSWPHDGHYLAFAIHYGAIYELWLYDTESEMVQPLKMVESARTGVTLRLSSDGSMLAYKVVNVKYDPAVTELYIYRIADQQEVFISSETSTGMVWSPTNTYLATRKKGVNILVIYKIEE